MNEQELYSAENELGLYVHAVREARGYKMEDVCDGICSVPTMSRIEAGERVVDYLLIEALLDRMKIAKTEYEFVLDEDDYSAYKQRNDIKMLIQGKQYKEAEDCLSGYEKKYGGFELHQQFLYYQRAMLQKRKMPQDKCTIGELFHKAISVTVPDYEQKMEKREILSSTELVCVAEMIHCVDDVSVREKAYEKLYDYNQWCYQAEGLFPVSYRLAMQYYAECLYEKEQYEKCIRICDEVLEELYKTSKLENRCDVFVLRAKAREKLGFQNQEDRTNCIRDYLTAYYVIGFFDGEEQAEELKQYIGERYGWQYIV